MKTSNMSPASSRPIILFVIILCVNIAYARADQTTAVPASVPICTYDDNGVRQCSNNLESQPESEGPDSSNDDMVLNTSIGNDRSKEKLCASRSKGKLVPFMISKKYVESIRSTKPDATFVAIDGISPQLVECELRSGTGKFEPASSSPEQAFWHLVKPEGFKPGIKTREGINMANNACIEKYRAQSNRPNFDHAVINASANEVGQESQAVIAGKKPHRYDIIVKGTSFYKSSGPDLKAVPFTCLFSPSLEVRAIQSTK